MTWPDGTGAHEVKSVVAVTKVASTFVSVSLPARQLPEQSPEENVRPDAHEVGLHYPLPPPDQLQHIQQQQE